jgi:hypothetical protein
MKPLAKEYIATLIKMYYDDFKVLPFVSKDAEGDLIQFDIEEEFLNECYKYMTPEEFLPAFEEFVNDSLKNLLDSNDELRSNI